MKLLAGLLFVAGLSAQPVKVWEGTLTLPTYQEGKADVNPPFDILSTNRLAYPYTMRENITSRRIDQKWRAIFLENEYLKCSVLPDMGGHLYNCTDKLNGADMFYANTSIKKARVSIRGAWAAFGVEFNFPTSHSWVSVSPVDFATVKHADGSASVWVGNTDRVYGMHWRVELILRPGRTVLEQRVRLYNSSDIRHRFYWWNNAALRVWDDTRIDYPQNYTASHGFTKIDTWPVNSEGLDLSVYGNHTKGTVSQFAYATNEPFVAIYHPRTKAGTVHYSLQSEIPSKKIWSWGADPDGKDWRKALSDDESAYVEVQGGFFRNQETFAFLAPEETLEFSEYWIPVRELGGVARATLDAVVNFQRGQDVTMGVNVTRAFPNARVKILNGESVVSDERASLQPAKTFQKKLPVGGHYRVELTDAGGRTLLAHTEGEYDMAKPGEIKPGPQQSYRLPPLNARSEGDFVEVAKDLELNGRLLTAWDSYAMGLVRFPESFELNKAAGRLAVDLGRYREAATMLQKAQRRISNDSEVHYYLGIAYQRLGDEKKARFEWDRAMVFRAFKAPAMLEMVRLRARQGGLAEALELVRQAIADSPKSLRAGVMEVTLLRRTGQAAKAKERLAYWQKEDPTSPALRLEAEKLGTADAALASHLSADPERVLNLATNYMELGLFNDALELLAKQYPDVDAAQSEPGTLRPQDHPLIAYYRGYCREKLGQRGKADFDKAAGLSTQYVFPKRPETADVLGLAIQSNASDATAHYLLGSLRLSQGMVDNAVAEWEAARRLNKNIPVLHRNLGSTLLVLKRQPERAMEVFREGLSVDRENVALYSGLLQTLSLLGHPPQELAEVLRSYPTPDTMPTPLVFNLALSLAESGKIADAYAQFPNRFFAREEGGTNVRQIYLEVRLQEALALARAGKGREASAIAATLGQETPGLAFTKDGLSVFIDSARFQYYLGEIESLAGNAEAAKTHWRAAMVARDRRGGNSSLPFAYRAARRLGDPGQTELQSRIAAAVEHSAPSLESTNAPGPIRYFRGLLLRELGRESEAKAEFREALFGQDRGETHYMTRIALSEAAVKPQ